MKRNLLLLVLLAFALTAVSSSFAQTGIVSIGEIQGLKNLDTLVLGQNIRILIKFNNNTGVRVNVSNGYKLSSPDGAVWNATTIDSIGPNFDPGTPEDPTDDFNNYFNKYFKTVANSFQEFSADGVGADTVGYIGAGTPIGTNSQLPATWNDTVYAITLVITDSNTVKGKHVCIDSSFFGTGGTWVWVGRDLIDYHPTWEGLFPGQTYNAGTGDERIGSGYCFIFEGGAPVAVDETDSGNLPKVFAVSQNYPNPFNPVTRINYDVPRKARVTLSIYNVLGQKVATLIDADQTPGTHYVDWDGSQSASGIYFYKFQAGNFVQTKKMVLMK